MSTVQDKLKAIKALFGMEQPATPAAPPAEPAPAALGSYKLADGTEVSISELTVGGIVTIGDAPAPAGEHMLEDGTKIKLDDMGVITEIEAATPAAPATPAMPQTPEEMSQLMQKFAVGTPEERLANLEIIARALFENSFGWELREATQKAIRDQALNVYRAGFEAAEQKITTLTEANKQLVELMEQFAAAPTGNPVEPAQQKFGKANAESKEERLAKITASLKALKK